MTTGLLRHHVQTLRLRHDAPWPSQQRRARRRYLLLRVIA